MRLQEPVFCGLTTTRQTYTTRFLEFLSSSSVWPHVGWLARLAQPPSRESTISSSHHECILSLHRFHATPLLHASVELVSYLCNTRLFTDHAWSLNTVLHTVPRLCPSMSQDSKCAHCMCFYLLPLVYFLQELNPLIQRQIHTQSQDKATQRVDRAFTTRF